MFGNTQIASISQSAPLANTLVSEGKIKIEIVVCHIRRNISQKKNVHIAAKCKSPHDFSEFCRQCGKENEIMAGSVICSRKNFLIACYFYACAIIMTCATEEAFVGLDLVQSLIFPLKSLNLF